MSDVDEYLIHRTEQAVLGALLAGADPAGAGALRAKGFADPVHQAIYAAFTRPGGNWTGRLRDQLARITNRDVRSAVDYITALPGLCPNAAHLGVYAGLLRRARPGHHVAGNEQAGQPPSQSRQAASPGQQLEGASQWLSASTTGRHAQRGTSELPDPATERLSRAIRAALRSGRLRERRRPQAPEAGTPGTRAAQAASGNTPPSLHKESLQDAVLADLMRHPGDGRELVQRVPLNVFTRGPRQDLYRLIALPIVAGKPVDWLITAWQARMREVSGHGARPATGATATESLTAIAIRLGSMRTARGTAGVIGRALLGDYEVSMAFGADWTRQRELNWAAVARPAPPRQPNGRDPMPQPATGYPRVPRQGGQAQRLQSPVQRPPAQRPPWDSPGQLPGPGPVSPR